MRFGSSYERTRSRASPICAVWTSEARPRRDSKRGGQWSMITADGGNRRVGGRLSVCSSRDSIVTPLDSEDVQHMVTLLAV